MPHDGLALIPGTVTISGLDLLVWEEVIHELHSAAHIYRLAGLSSEADDVERHIHVLNWHAVHAE